MAGRPRRRLTFKEALASLNRDGETATAAPQGALDAQPTVLEATGPTAHYA